MILAFTDVETTHLSADTGEVWEVAVILRDTDSPDTDVEHVWQFRPLTPQTADPKSLAIGRFDDRFVVPDDCAAAYITDGDIDPMARADAIDELAAFLCGAVIVGSNPAFDDRFLRKLLDLRGKEQPWHYRPLDIAALAAGYLWAQEPELMARDTKPINSRWLSRQVGVEPPGDDAHQALADAKWALRVYDAVTSGKAVTG